LAAGGESLTTRRISLTIHQPYKDFVMRIPSFFRYQPMPRRPIRLALEQLEDRRTPAATISVVDATVFEGNSGTRTALVQVTVSEPHGNSITVNYSTANGTAVAGTDFTAVSGKLTFAKNERSKWVSIPVAGDRLIEANKDFWLQLSNPKGGKIADGSGLVTIQDDEPRVSTADAGIWEGNSGSSPLTFYVNLSNAYDLPVTVNYSTADWSALAGSDYTSAAGTLTFAPGQTSLPVPVQVHGDHLGEWHEVFTLRLSSPNTYAQVSDDVASGTIFSDEPQIHINDVWNYGESTFTFTVSLSVAYDQPVTVDFTAADGTALAGRDYVMTAGTLTFAPGETLKTITVEVLDPTLAPDKYFLMRLSNATTNAIIMTPYSYGWWYYDCGCGGGGDGWW
jgi:hypothetical protein